MAMTRAEIARKIDWEGGLAETLEWGLRLDDLPEDDLELRGAFADMARAFAEFDQLGEAFMRLLPDPFEGLTGM